MSENEIELIFKATIEYPWHMYSQFLPEEAAATATEFTFLSNESYKLIESAVESGVIEAYDPVEESVLKFFGKGGCFHTKDKSAFI